MLMWLSMKPNAHILFVHVTTKVEICLVTEKNSHKLVYQLLHLIFFMLFFNKQKIEGKYF